MLMNVKSLFGLRWRPLYAHFVSPRLSEGTVLGYFVDVVVTLPGCSIQRLPPIRGYPMLFAEKRDETKTI